MKGLSPVFLDIFIFLIIGNDADDIGLGVDDAAQGLVVAAHGQGRSDEADEAADDGCRAGADKEIA